MKIDPNAPAYPVYGNHEAPRYGMTIRAKIASEQDIPWELAKLALDKACGPGQYTTERLIEYRAYLQVLAAEAIITQLNKE